MMLHGTGVSGGVACARLYVLRRHSLDVDASHVPALSPEEWGLRLGQAVASAKAELTAVAGDAQKRLGADEAGIFEAQLMMLGDEEWWGEVDRLVREGTPAPAAVRAVSEALAAEFQALDDAYLRERSADVLDVEQRVLQALGAVARAHLPSAADGEVILAAEELAPSETLGLDPRVVRAIVVERGAKTSHAAILARQLGIPAVVAVSGLLEVARDGVLCAVDGDRGSCELDPDAATAELFRVDRAVVDVVPCPVTTADGVPVFVHANAASPQEVATATAMGADGVGLFRTELLISRPEHLLDEDRQVAAYSAAAIATEGRPIVFRTFDVGGDKPVAGFSVDGEANPFLGLRGVRLCFERLDVFTTQLRAIARVGRDHPNVEILIPMISGVEELERVIALLAEVDPDHRLKIGTMVEVPSASLLAHELAARCDFLSVGTNDLTAYILAADRTNASLQGLYSELHPAVIRTLSSILVAGRETGTKVSVCGELAGDVRALPLLIGLGLRHFSAAAPLVPRLKHAIQSIDSQQAQELASQVLQSSKVQEVEDLVDEWIAAH